MRPAWTVGAVAWAGVYAGYAAVRTPPNLVVGVVELVVPVLLAGIVVQLATRRHGDGPDAAERVLAAAVATLPADRRDWGAAMTAELAGLDDPAARRAFAGSGARAALWLAVASTRTAAALAAGTVAAALAAGIVRTVMPELTLFAGLFAGLVGALSAIAERDRWPTGVVTAGVAVAIASTVTFLRGDLAGTHPTPKASVYLAVALAGCLWLSTRRRAGAAREIGSAGEVGAAAVVVAWFLLSLHLPESLVLPLLAAPLAAFAVPAFLAARSDEVRTGVHTAVRIAILAAPLTYAAYLPEAARRYVSDGRMLDGDILAPTSITLTDGMALCLGVLPVLGLAVGVLGAGLAARVTDRPPAVL